LESANPVNLPVAARISDQVICLPIFPDMAEDVQDRVIEICMEMCQYNGVKP